jgi:hypothetical protein
MEKMKQKDWIEVNESDQFIYLKNWKQIRHLAGKA